MIAVSGGLRKVPQWHNCKFLLDLGRLRVVSITDCVQGVTDKAVFKCGIHDRESREHKGKREEKSLMSFVGKQSSGDQPSVKSGWREARVPEGKAKGIV
jgi:hypothetical protein